MQQYTFLVEIGTEELPYKTLKRLGCSFAKQINHALQKNGFYCIETQWFVSSCHLAVKSRLRINNIDNSRCYVEKCSVYDDNAVCCVTDIREKKDEMLVLNFKKGGSNINNTLCAVVRIALSKLADYTMMKWSDIDTPFVRPVHAITILLDTYLIQGDFFGICTDRILYGHKFMKNNKIVIHHADEYPEILFREGQVVVEYNKRREIICLKVQELAKKIGGITSIKDDDLFDEVTALVEWPVILFGKFDKKFLCLPSEVVNHIMRYDQKYFSVYDPINGTLLPYFIFVVNVITNNYQKVIAGYENVIKPRLMDAEFFLNKDGQCRLESYMCQLDTVLFHSNLGTLRDKSIRIATLSVWIASQIGVDIQQAKRAGYLCKCDLMSSMVCEFPELQGIIGMYYALRDGESAEVALAQKEHYHPKFSTDVLPTTTLSCVVAIADKMDTISGIFGIKELPRGNRDPFALRRFAFGILRILIQKRLSLNLSTLIEESVKLYKRQLINVTVIKDIHMFMYQRLYSWYCMRDIKVSVIKAVLSVDYFDIVNVDVRIQAVHKFYTCKQEEYWKLCLIYKRISNIMTNDQGFFVGDFRKALLKLPEEIQLFDQVELLEEKIKILLNNKRNTAYDEILELLMTLLEPIDNFFNYVVVIDKNSSIRKNRLILLKKIRNLFLKIMDVSFLYN